MRRYGLQAIWVFVLCSGVLVTRLEAAAPIQTAWSWGGSQDGNGTVLENPEAAQTSYPSQNGEPRYRWAAGVSYTGLQVRFHFAPRWATEARAQFGEADSNYGKVDAHVVGLRLYRFIPYRQRLAWYLGGEGAYAQAEAQSSSYETKGFAMGTFAGMEYRVHRRVSVGLDVGPYMISLRESQTGLGRTSLDFVVNTALNFYLFK